MPSPPDDGNISRYAMRRPASALEVGEDIDAVSRATFTVTTATHAIRQGARQLAREWLIQQDSDR